MNASKVSTLVGGSNAVRMDGNVVFRDEGVGVTGADGFDRVEVEDEAAARD